MKETKRKLHTTVGPISVTPGVSMRNTSSVNAKPRNAMTSVRIERPNEP